MNGLVFKPQASLFLAAVAIVTVMSTLPAWPQARGGLGNTVEGLGNAVGGALGGLGAATGGTRAGVGANLGGISAGAGASLDDSGLGAGLGLDLGGRDGLVAGAGGGATAGVGTGVGTLVNLGGRPGTTAALGASPNGATGTAAGLGIATGSLGAGATAGPPKPAAASTLLRETPAAVVPVEAAGIPGVGSIRTASSPAMKKRCGAILSASGTFDDDLVSLCRMIAGR